MYGLIPDNQLLMKGKAVFGEHCYAAGDAVRIGEGTSAVLRGKQTAIEILMDLGARVSYDDYLVVSKEYIDSQQHPVRILKLPVCRRRNVCTNGDSCKWIVCMVLHVILVLLPVLMGR